MYCSAALSLLVLLFNFLKGPGLSLLEIGTDIYNTVHFHNPCLLPSGINVKSLALNENCQTVNRSQLMNLTYVDYDQDKGNCVHVIKESWQKNEPFSLVIKSTLLENQTCRVILKNDPIWAGLSAMFIFSPGWILAIYLILSKDQWWDTERVETVTVIIIGTFGYPIMLLVFQFWAWIFNHKKKENYSQFLYDFLPIILGVEAFGDAAPAVVLNGFVIASKYPLGSMQLAGLFISLMATTLRVLEYDFIPEIDEIMKKDQEGSSKSVLAYITLNKKIRENKTEWVKFASRIFVLFFFYLLCNVARSASLCCIFLYCREVGVLPVFINMAFVAYLIRKHHKGDWASCFVFSITNLFICSNGGPDNIKATSFKLMASTTKVCMGIFITFQLNSMYLAYRMRQNPYASLKRYSEFLDLGVFGKANSGWFCSWVIYLNVIHFILLHIIKKWLPKTEYEIYMDQNTESREKQMEEKGSPYVQRPRKRKNP